MGTFEKVLLYTTFGLVFLATVNNIQLREDVIALQIDNASQWQQIRANIDVNAISRLQAVERNIAAIERDNYKEKKLTPRQKEALDKRFGLNTGENRPFGGVR